MVCAICRKGDRLYTSALYVMEWSDTIAGSRQVQQSRICGAVQVEICEDCIREYVAKKTKGLTTGKKVKEAANKALASGNYDQFINQIAAWGLKSVIDRPNAGKSKAFNAWAQANAADHLLNETFIPAEYVTACFVSDANGNTSLIPKQTIRYTLARPSTFKFIEYDSTSDNFQFVDGEQWIDPKWLMASEMALHECKSFLNL